jgi:hypothetical protein
MYRISKQNQYSRHDFLYFCPYTFLFFYLTKVLNNQFLYLADLKIQKKKSLQKMDECFSE